MIDWSKLKRVQSLSELERSIPGTRIIMRGLTDRHMVYEKKSKDMWLPIQVFTPRGGPFRPKNRTPISLAPQAASVPGTHGAKSLLVSALEHRLLFFWGGEDSMTLQDQVTKLAYDNPGPIREALLPILKKHAGRGIGEEVARLFPRNSYLNRFFLEKDIPYKTFTVRDSQGLTHTIPNQVVVEHIAQTGPAERRKIENIIRQIDFRAGDINHFFEHLAKAIAEQYEGALR